MPWHLAEVPSRKGTEGAAQLKFRWSEQHTGQNNEERETEAPAPAQPELRALQVGSGITSYLGPCQGALHLQGTDLLPLIGALMLSQGPGAHALAALKKPGDYH